MNIDIIKNKIKEFQKEKLRIKVYLGRNKYEYYEGYIDKMYENIFVLSTNRGIKTFSYSDIATKIVILKRL